MIAATARRSFPLSWSPLPTPLPSARGCCGMK